MCPGGTAFANAGPATSDERRVWENAVAVLIAEHGALVTARATVTSDSSARSNLFLGAVSSSLVALAFVAQADHLGRAVQAFAFALLPALLYLGLLTFVRTLEDAGKDALYGRAINRVRRYYVDLYPHAVPYFTFSTDAEGALELTSSGGLAWERRLTAQTSVSAINATVGGVLAGLAASLLVNVPFPQAVLLGAIAAAAVLASSAWYESRYWASFERRIAERYSNRTIGGS
jgi:hypothetical protein